MKEIPLTQGKVALVDDEDYEYFSQWKWYARKDSKTDTYYAVRNQRKSEDTNQRETILMHREILLRVNEDASFPEIDHFDQDGLNNQKKNLRWANRKVNCENRKVFRNNTSGRTGVYWNKSHRKWQAKIRHNYRLINLGSYASKDEAIEARLEAEKKYFTHSEGSKS